MNTLALLPILAAAAYAAVIPVPLHYSSGASLPLAGAGWGAGSYVERIPIQAPTRTHTKYTPLVDQVVPEVKLYHQKFQVDVPKPVFQQKVVTPVQTVLKSVPVAVEEKIPVPYAQPVPVHVGHEVAFKSGQIVHAAAPQQVVFKSGVVAPAAVQVQAPHQVTFKAAPVAPAAVHVQAPHQVTLKAAPVVPAAVHVQAPQVTFKAAPVAPALIPQPIQYVAPQPVQQITAVKHVVDFDDSNEK